jgi:hypothetical protein
MQDRDLSHNELSDPFSAVLDAMSPRHPCAPSSRQRPLQPTRRRAAGPRRTPIPQHQQQLNLSTNSLTGTLPSSATRCRRASHALTLAMQCVSLREIAARHAAAREARNEVRPAAPRRGKSSTAATGGAADHFSPTPNQQRAALLLHGIDAGP